MWRALSRRYIAFQRFALLHSRVLLARHLEQLLGYSAYLRPHHRRIAHTALYIIVCALKRLNLLFERAHPVIGFLKLRYGVVVGRHHIDSIHREITVLVRYFIETSVKLVSHV